ncbi:MULTISPECIES: hypothetical protein [unclassified Lonepinella]|uniref:hypothetical protein n=1 Tax=unclassified Lonepinella TaxID=2642006 RepID=UPI003F6DDC13
MFNLFRQPYEKETLNDWAKLCVDVAKVAILAIPVMLYGESPIQIKIINTILLCSGVYAGLYMGRQLHKLKEEL